MEIILDWIGGYSFSLCARESDAVDIWPEVAYGLVEIRSSAAARLEKPAN